MGSYAECWLSSFYLGSTKGQVDPSILQLFRSSDKKVISGTKRDIPFQLHRWTENVEEDENIEVVFYSTPLRVVRDRLELDGYTLETSKIAFEKWITKEISQYESWVKGKHGEAFLEPLNFLKMTNANIWMSTLTQIHDKGLSGRSTIHQKNKYKGTLSDYMLNDRQGWYGYPGWDLNVAIRLALEALPTTEELVYDLTDLVLSGDYSKDDDYVDKWTEPRKTIILTEGNTDAWAISESLHLLYPHLSDYFTFMDFESARIGGGAGSLANIVKAFSGTGIVNKVVAFFDNDTAAATALRALRLIQIPSNIQIIQLPRLDFLENYPTLGPSGSVSMDINGLAGSIELYLGKDVLVDSSNNLIPVQWAGYIPELGRYQGEVLAKEDIQKRYRQKLIQCKANQELLAKTDWDGMKAILKSLFTVFHETDREGILSLVDELN